MQTSVPKEIREDIARAKGYLSRDEVPRALEAVASALRQCAGLQLVRQARSELEWGLEKILGDICRHAAMLPLLDPQGTGKPKAITYQKNKEGLLATVLENLARILQQAAAQQAENAQAEQEQRKNDLIATGIERIKAGELARGRAFMKRAAAEFGDQEGVCQRIGQALLELQQYPEAAEVLEQAIEHNPKDTAAYTLAIEASCNAREFAKAEAVYMKILHQFGGHPRTYGKMAQLYMLWQKRNEAEDMALRALQVDPDQPEAKEVMLKLERKG